MESEGINEDRLKIIETGADQTTAELVAEIRRLRARGQENAALRASVDELKREVWPIVHSLRWTGDGYEWNPRSRDYREDPLSAVRAMLGDFDKELAAAQKWKDGAGELSKEIDRLKGELRVHRDKAKGDYWAWQGDGEDHLESLVCPVLIRPEVLSALMKKHCGACGEIVETPEGMIQHITTCPKHPLAAVCKVNAELVEEMCACWDVLNEAGIPDVKEGTAAA
jgi:hypothetical protein